MFRASVLALVLFGLGGCATLPALAVAGSGASIWTAVQNAGQTVDDALVLDRPIKQVICDAEPNKSPEFQAWCDHLPTDMSGLIAQWAAVYTAHEIRIHTEAKP